MKSKVSLADVRSAINRRKRVSFTYQGTEVTADLYLLGQARKTGAYVILAWCIEPVAEWHLLRYSFITNLETVGEIDEYRGDFNPYHPEIMIVDTQAYYLPHRPH